MLIKHISEKMQREWITVVENVCTNTVFCQQALNSWDVHKWQARWGLR